MIKRHTKVYLGGIKMNYINKDNSRYFCYLKFKFDYNYTDFKNEDEFNKELDKFEEENIWSNDTLEDIANENIYCNEDNIEIKLDIESSDSYYDYENKELIITTPTTIYAHGDIGNNTFIKSLDKKLEICPI